MIRRSHRAECVALLVLTVMAGVQESMSQREEVADAAKTGVRATWSLVNSARIWVVK